MSHPLHVKLPVYDGPLDLLLELIKKNEMDIYDIPIAEITRQYLESLATMKQLDLEIAGEFIVMAATLIYIKSKMLLPQDAEEDEEGEDPRAELVRKLLEYQAFKEAARELGMLEGERAKIFTRQLTDYYLAELGPEDVGIDTFSANLYDLLSAFQGVLVRAAKTEIHEVFEQVVTIEEKLAELRRLLTDKGRIIFSELFEASAARDVLIVTFLALLELVRTRFARVRQSEPLGQILIEKREDRG